MSGEHHSETVICQNCEALSREGFVAPEGGCPGVDMGATSHNWVPDEEIGPFEDDVQLQPQAAEVEMTADTNHVVRFSFEEPDVVFCVWTDEELPDTDDILSLEIPAEVATHLARRPCKVRFPLDVDGTRVWVSASLVRSKNAEPAVNGRVIEEVEASV